MHSFKFPILTRVPGTVPGTRVSTRSVRETRAIGAQFAKKIVAPAVVGLIGDLGSGKTTFVQGMAAGLGIDPRYYVSSPSFTFVNEYGNRLIHVDLYRIERPEELETLGLEDYLSPGRIVVVEWAERLQFLARWPAPDFQVRFEIVSDKEREIEIVPSPVVGEGSGDSG